MAILDFLSRKSVKDDSASYAPHSNVVRGAGGRFVSKKKPEAPIEQKKPLKVKKSTESAFKGPFAIPFAGREVRRYYADGTWFFPIEDLVILLSAVPPVKSFKELKEDDELSKIIKPNLKTIGEVECSDAKGASKILLAVIRKYKAMFPGQIFRWLEGISTHEYIEGVTPGTA